MSENDSKVQNAISKLLKAGFQISPATLAMLQTEKNPKQIVDRFLASDAVHPTETPILEPFHIQPSQQEPVELAQGEETISQEIQIPHLTSSAKVAEGVKADIRVIKDPTPELQGKGSIEDFSANFQDRYYRLRDIFAQRVDGRGITNIRDVTTTYDPNEKTPPVKIIGLVTNKTLTKSGNIALEVEDPTGSIVVIVQQRDPNVMKKASVILLDQVLVIEGAAFGANMLIAKDLYLPDTPSNRKNNRAKENISALLLSDIHFGSQKFLDKVFRRFLDWLQGTEGDDDHIALANSVKYIIINGDLVDGVGVYPKQLSELTLHDLDSQFNGLNQLLEEIPSHIEIIITPGNHDGVRVAIPRPAIEDQFLGQLKDVGLSVLSLGCPAQVSLHGVNLLIYHGDSLIDIMGALSKPDVEASYAAMREMLRGRHLAPIYGKSTPIVAEPRDWLVIDEVPDILHCGHIHVTSVGSYRKTLMINSGTFQSQTEYQKLIGIEPTPGVVPLVNLRTLSVKTLNFI